MGFGSMVASKSIKGNSRCEARATGRGQKWTGAALTKRKCLNAQVRKCDGDGSAPFVQRLDSELFYQCQELCTPCSLLQVGKLGPRAPSQAAGDVPNRA